MDEQQNLIQKDDKKGSDKIVKGLFIFMVLFAVFLLVVFSTMLQTLIQLKQQLPILTSNRGCSYEVIDKMRNETYMRAQDETAKLLVDYIFKSVQSVGYVQLSNLNNTLILVPYQPSTK